MRRIRLHSNSAGVYSLKRHKCIKLEIHILASLDTHEQHSKCSSSQSSLNLWRKIHVVLVCSGVLLWAVLLHVAVLWYLLHSIYVVGIQCVWHGMWCVVSSPSWRELRRCCWVTPAQCPSHWPVVFLMVLLCHPCFLTSTWNRLERLSGVWGFSVTSMQMTPNSTSPFQLTPGKLSWR